MKNHKFKIGDVVNDSLIIVNQTRHGKENRLAYEVQSKIYSNAPTYIITERKLNIGQGCTYKTGKRVFEGNSLYSIDWARPYIVDKEHSKTITPGSGKKTMFKCLCGKEKLMTPPKFFEYGVSCPVCSKGTSYPELLIISYLEVKGLQYEYQKTFDDLPNRRFDFFVHGVGILETHGGQHFKNTFNWDYKETVISDEDKRNYCKEKNITLIELDCQKSYFKYIVQNINKNDKLPKITKEDELEIMEIMAKNNRYPIKEIVETYKNGLSTLEMVKEFNISGFTISNILKNQGVNLRGSHKKVKCITTGKIFNSLKEAGDYYGISNSHISSVCKGKRKSSGKHPKTNESLRWEYISIDNYEYY